MVLTFWKKNKSSRDGAVFLSNVSDISKDDLSSYGSAHAFILEIWSQGSNIVEGIA